MSRTKGETDTNLRSAYQKTFVISTATDILMLGMISGFLPI